MRKATASVNPILLKIAAADTTIVCWFRAMQASPKPYVKTAAARSMLVMKAISCTKIFALKALVSSVVQ